MAIAPSLSTAMSHTSFELVWPEPTASRIPDATAIASCLAWLRTTVVSMLLVMGIGLSSPTLAQGMVVAGVTETLHYIGKSGVIGPDGGTLSLGYKVSMYVLGASWWMHDDGYVLFAAPPRGKYFPLSQAQISAYQRAGALPTPLPRYSLSIFDYLMGLSGWIALGGAMVWFGGRHLWRRISRRTAQPR